MIFSFIVPIFYPYSYKEQMKGANHLAPMEYSEEEHRADPSESGNSLQRGKGRL